MKPREDTPKERQCILRLLDKKPAQLPWPRSNRALLAMVGEGLADVTHRWDDHMGNGKVYHCAKIAITDAGREALTE